MPETSWPSVAVSPQQEAFLSIVRAEVALTDAVEAVLAPHGLSATQYNVLRILRGAGDEGLPTLAVRDRLVEEAPGITRLIDKLESAKLVRRDRTGRDRRTVRCHITPAGLELLEKADEHVRGIQTIVAAGLPDEADRVQLVELLARLRAAFPPGAG